MRRRHALTLGIVGLTLLLGGERSWAGPPDPTHSDKLGNTAGGTGALSRNTTGADNTAFGDNALLNNTIGTDNTATGSRALSHNVDGDGNTASGLEALLSDTTGGVNTAIGVRALHANTTADFNTAIGGNALFNNTTGCCNTASGAFALFDNTTGVGNTAAGDSALQLNTTGGANTATGQDALRSNTTGGFNTAVGEADLTQNTTGNNNTALGDRALINLVTGRDNVAVGADAGGSLGSGDENVYLGGFVSGGGTESGTMRLGGPNQTRTFIGGIAGVTVANGAPVLIDTRTGQLGAFSSSARYKSDIEPMGAHSGGLLELRPVTFRYTQDMQKERQYGLIAEEVAKVYPELVTSNAAGEVEAVRYHALIPMLLNEVQQQQQQLASLRATVKQLQERQAARTERSMTD